MDKDQIKREKRKEYLQKTKEQRALVQKAYREANKEKIREVNLRYRQDSDQKIKLKKKEYAAKNKDKLSAYKKEYRANNKDTIQKWKDANADRIAENNKRWKEANKDRVNARRRQAPQNVRIKNTFRSRFKSLIRAGSRGKSRSWSGTNWVGCDELFLIDHISKQFTPEMNWSNWGQYWHIDHIIPCAAFNHENEYHIRLCWHWTNLRPLEARENIMKSDRILEDHQMELPLVY